MAITAYRKISGVEITFSDSTAHAFPKHSHDEFYIGANVSGREKIWLDGKSDEASVDEITIYNPGQVQSAIPTPYTWLYYSFYIQPDMLRSLSGFHDDEEFKRSIFCAPDTAHQIRETARFCLDSSNSNGEVIEHLACLLNTVIKRAGVRYKCELGHNDSLLAEKIACRLKSEMLSPPSLIDLAAENFVTPVQLVRIFSHTYGLPPISWLRCEKLKLSKQLILSGDSISAVAADLGFSDQAHYTRNFKNMFGITPGALYNLVNNV